MILDKFRLAGRIALVTGSSGGIGEALAIGLAQAGAVPVVNGRNGEKVEAVARAIEKTGGKAHRAVFDVTDADAAEAAVERIEAQAGPIDILINNAGINRRAPLDEFPIETWREVIATNLDSVFYVTKPVARRMIPRKRGAIINICSVTSELARPTVAPYTASKGAVKMLTKAMAADWGRHGIRVNGIGPGYITTEMNKALIADEKFSAWVCDRTPLGRWASVEELVGAAVFLSSEAASYVTGHVLYVDGGMTARV